MVLNIIDILNREVVAYVNVDHDVLDDATITFHDPHGGTFGESDVRSLMSVLDGKSDTAIIGEGTKWMRERHVRVAVKF